MLHEQRNNDGLFLSVKRGALCLESAEEKEGYELVEGEVDGRPYSKYVKKFAGLDGLITKVEWYERTGDHGTFRGLKLHIKDRGEHYFLDLPFEKRPYDYYTKVAENIDYAVPVEIVAWQDRKDPRVTAFAIKQHGAFIQWKYTREEMGECPEAKQLRTGKWSFDDQREWLLDRIVTVVIPLVDATHEFAEPEPEYSGADEEEAEAEKPTSVREVVAKRAAEERAKAVGAGADLTDPNNPLDSGPDTSAPVPENVAKDAEIPW